MKTVNFPYIALAMSLFLLPVVIVGSETDSNGVSAIPVLTLLVISEFSFFVTAIGAYIGTQQVQRIGIKPLYTAATAACVLLATGFMWIGIDLWPL